jgi:lysophospholipase L1-like esterase
MRLLLLPALLSAAMAARAADAPVAPVPISNSEWRQRHESLLTRAKQGGVELMFVGDSITQLWNDNEVWMARYAPLKAANFGASWDTAESALWRLQNGELEGLSPKVVVLLIGVNSLSHGDSPEDAARAVAAVLGTLRQKLPKTKVLLLGIFPAACSGTDPFRAKVKSANSLLAGLADKDRVRYLDLGPALLRSDGSISPDVMGDCTHPTVKGYRLWADAMDPLLNRMLKAAASPASL